MKKLVAVDLFAGVGGLALGLMASGLYEVVALSDCDEIARDNFEHNFPPDQAGNPKYICKKIERLTAKELREAAGGRAIDVITGGPPCQGFSQSMAGQRAYEDERNHLFKEYFRIVRALRPKALIIENVPEFIMLFEGKIFKEVRDHLDDLGYRCAVDILNAARYGVPQSRQRVIIVAIRKDLNIQPRLPNPTHGGSDQRLYNYLTRGYISGCRETLRDPAAGKFTYGDDIMGSTSVISAWRMRHLLSPNGYSLDGTALAQYPCQVLRPGRRQILQPLVTVEQALSDLTTLLPGQESREYACPPTNLFQRARRGGRRELTNHKAWDHTESMVERLDHVPEGGDISDVPKSLRPKKWFSQAYARLHRHSLARTITTYFHNPGSGRFTHYKQTRTITVREAARLQSFDDKIVFIGYPSNHERLVGNAVPPLLARAICQQLYRDLCQAPALAVATMALSAGRLMRHSAAKSKRRAMR